MITQSIGIRAAQHRRMTVSLKSRLEALLAPLARLDQRLQQTLEVRRTLLGTAFEGYLLGGAIPTQPPASVIKPESSLAHLQQIFELSDFDLEVVLMAIAPELDRRYARLYSDLQPTANRRPTVGLALDLLCQSVVEKEVMRDHFQKEAPLIRHGLLQLKPAYSKAAHLAPEAISAEDSFVLNPSVSRHLLGQPMTPQLASHCQLSWPTETVQLTNSPVLLELLKRLSSEQVSAQLALNFTGAGAKSQSAQMIAATVNRPLLTIDIHRLFGNTSLDQHDAIAYAAQQVLLQGRLWDAVLYIESEEAQNDSRWTPTVIARSFSQITAHTPSQTQLSNLFCHASDAVNMFCRELTHYPGIVIFTGQAVLVPNANQNKGVINIPFLPLPSDSASTDWREVAHITLGETELFRQRLIETSLES
ncbi:MAG: hypothetical protein AAFQ63_09385 [Cyanobacteria bacterium J06621_11]